MYPLVGVRGFSADASAEYADAGQAPGESIFTILCAVTLHDAAEAAASGIAGAGGAATDGWLLQRLADPAAGTCALQWSLGFSGGVQTNSQTFNKADVIGRTLLLGVTVAATAVIYYTNGGQVATDTGTGAVAAALSAFTLGAAAGLAGTSDVLHGFLYAAGTAPSALRMGIFFNTFLRTRSFQQAALDTDAFGTTPDYIYDAQTLAQPPSITPPTTWDNLGTAGGELTWGGPATNNFLTFSVNNASQFSNGVP